MSINEEIQVFLDNYNGPSGMASSFVRIKQPEKVRYAIGDETASGYMNTLIKHKQMV